MQFTRVLVMLFAGYAFCLKAQSAAAPVVRPITLSEVITMALEHNLDVQIQRLNPQIALLNLDSSVGAAFDPAFRFGASQSFNSTPGHFDPTFGFALPPNETYTESFNAGVGGEAPVTGTRYDLSTAITRTSGTAGILFGTNVATINRDFQYNPRAQITVTQPLLLNSWIDSARYQILFNKKTVKISEYTLSRQINTSVTQVEQAYYELIFARENVKVQEKALELAQRSLSENKRRVEVGAMAPLDEKQAESLAAGSKADLLAAQRLLSLQQNALKTLITDNYNAIHEVILDPVENLLPVVIPFDLQDSWQKALTLRPEILQAKAELERWDITLKYLKNQLFPQLDLVGTYGRNGLPLSQVTPSLDGIARGDNPYWTYGVQMSIPIGNRSARYRYQMNKAQKTQAILQLKQLEQGIMVDVDNAVKLAQSNFERIEATRQARLYAEAALDAEQKKLENGKSTSFVVLQLQRDLTTRRSDEIRALADYNDALSALSLSEGQTMNRHGLSIAH